jgi:outer membrane protein assembly factor BamA
MYYYVDNDLRLVGQSGGNIIVDRGRLFSDRVYGVAASLRYPLSMFTRLQFNAQHIYIDREYYDPNVLGFYENSNNQASVVSASWVRDNTLWGLTGPNNGGRSNVTAEYAADVSDRSLSYWAFNADFRRYLKMGSGFTFAVRMAGGASDGPAPKTYYLGGVPNWIGATLARPGEIYSIGSLYFSQSSFPLRGYNYYQLAGTRYGLMNFEFRFPLVEYFAMRFPLGLALSQVQGAVFLDAGAAWDEDTGFDLRAPGTEWALEDLKVGYGFALRANLGFFVFRWDVGWPTDFNGWDASARHYISMGADF